MSARGPSGASKKLRNYCSDLRPGDLKLLCVLKGDRMEQHVQEAARNGGIQVLTTTLERLRRFPRAGGPRLLVPVWRTCHHRVIMCWRPAYGPHQ